jgi:hypothetical protein
MIDQVDLLANRAFETYAEQVPEIRDQFGPGPHPKLEEPFLGYWRAVVIAVLSEYQTAKPLSAIMPDQPKENMKFTKKPVTIEATRFPESVRNDSLWQDYERAISRLAEWCGGEAVFLTNDSSGANVAYIDIKTLEGTMRATPGDWIVKGVKGEFYPCKPDVFEESYDAKVTFAEPLAPTKSWRKELDFVLQKIKGASLSRERSLAITKLQEAIMWLGMDLKAQNEPNPYPHSYNPDFSPSAVGSITGE